MNMNIDSCVYTKNSISIPIPIPGTIQPRNTKRKKNHYENEYALTKNCFDPTKCSPPNDFMAKLQMRMSIYNSLIKDDKFINE
jgi:hypothetical protein